MGQENDDQDIYAWQDPRKYVCLCCVPDKFLKRLIFKKRVKQRCNYCNTERLRSIAAPVSELMDPIVSAFKRHFSDPVHGGCFIDSDALHLVNQITTMEALRNLLTEWDEDDVCSNVLLCDITNAFQNGLWIEAPGGMYIGEHEYEAMTWSWEAFSRMVKHEQRFFFHVPNQQKPAQSLMPPSRMLPTIAHLVDRLGLVTQLDSGTHLFRARIREADGSWPLDAEHLGAPPPQKASAGRMNPTGMPYLYMALDKATAVAETVSLQKSNVVVGYWTIEKSMMVVDLTRLPAVPSVFDEARQRDREALLFLNEFVADIQKPIENNNEHIEYLPSQVVSEYFAKTFNDKNNAPIKGLKYLSAKRPMGVNFVFFPENNCIQGQYSEFKLNGYEELMFGDLVALVDPVS